MTLEGWFAVASLAIHAAAFGAIFRKAGYSGWLGLLALLPAVNFFVLLWFATAHWPLEMGYQAGHGTDPRANADWELKMAVRKALAFEKRGDVAHAIEQFELVAGKAGDGHPSAVMARERIGLLKSRVPAGTAQGFGSK